MFYFRRILFLTFIILSFGCTQETNNLNTGNVIFLHPDGVGLAGWNIMRVLYYGPDGESNWDKMPNMGLYRSHLSNSLGASSNAGATIHAYGVKASYNSFGSEEGTPIVSASGKELSIMKEAQSEGIKIGLINSGNIIEPGTAVFVSSAAKRSDYENITLQVLESGTDVILSGGERWMLPEDEVGFFGEPGMRQDGRNLIEESKKRGYSVVYTKEQLLNLPKGIKKLLGVFAFNHTFNDKSEEELLDAGLENFNPNAPTIAEMARTAIEILSQNNQRFFLVIEEEGSDNFANKNNANATFETIKRADDTIKLIRDYSKSNKNTLLIVASDSEASGPELVAFPPERMKPDENLPNTDRNGSPIDGVNGSGTKPFISAADKNGKTLPFGISWSSNDDVYGSVVVKAEGLNSELVKGNLDNTDIYRIMYATLFGKIIR